MNWLFHKFMGVKKAIGGFLILLVLNVCLASSESSAPKERQEPLSAEAFIKSAGENFGKSPFQIQMKSSLALVKDGSEVDSFDVEMKIKWASLSTFRIAEKGILKYEAIIFMKEERAFERSGADDRWKPASPAGPSEPKVVAAAKASGAPLKYLIRLEPDAKVDFNFAGQEKIGESLCRKVGVISKPGQSLNEPVHAFGLKDVKWESVNFESIYWIEEKTKRFLKISAIIKFLGNGGKIKYTIKVNMDFSHYGEDFDIEVPQEVKDLLKKQ